jgi:hypothetical protein
MQIGGAGSFQTDTALRAEHPPERNSLISTYIKYTSCVATVSRVATEIWESSSGKYRVSWAYCTFIIRLVYGDRLL